MEAKGKQKKTKKSHKILRAVGFIFLAILLIGIGGATYLALWYKQAISAIDTECEPGKCEVVSFDVYKGDGWNNVAARLEQDGLIRSAEAFKLYLRFSAKDVAFNAETGSYDLNKGMDVDTIINTLRDATQRVFSVTFLPGEQISAVKARLVKLGYSQTEVDAAFAKQYDHRLFADKPAGTSLEGYLYGETFEYYTTASVEDILTKNFDYYYNILEKNKIIEGFKAQGLNLYQGITMASIVQREAGSLPEEDHRIVAQVFLTRLKRGIPLGSDAVIGYAADQINPNRNKSDMSYFSTIQCPWHSRKCAGLPPSPIASPGLTSLKATANPSNTDYIYFLTGDDYKMYYAHTEAEHNANIRNHCKVMCSAF